MAVDILNETTLSEALTDSTVDFTVGSTTNITAGTSYLILQGTGGQEICFVQAIPVSGRVQVLRGVDGTRAVAHASGTRVFIATGSNLKRTGGYVDRTGTFVNLVGNSGNYLPYALPGTRGRDGIGNEYVMVELTATMYSGTTVVISVDGNFTATQAVGGTHGSIGILVEPGTSDQYVWAQIYGYQSFAQIDAVSAATSTYLLVPATSVSTPSVGLAVLVGGTTVNAYIIHGMWPTGVATTAVTSATSSTGTAIPVWLNYPYTLDRVEGLDTSNS